LTIRRRCPGARSAATVTRPRSARLSASVSVPGGPSITWSIPAAIASLLARVEWTSTTRWAWSKNSSETSGDSSAAAARGSSERAGAGSFATNEDINKARAIFEAATACVRQGVRVQPEVMIPLVGTVEELRVLDRLVREVAAEVRERTGRRVPFKVGTMIEVPRACLVADEIGQVAEFFSFGTNDLTQMTFGYSRDDAAKFLPEYLERRILPVDPFQTLDRKGVGRLVRLTIEEGRRAQAKLKIGICGEHGGDAPSVAFFHEVGADYVSCSPYRLPVARLAAAHAALAERRGGGSGTH